MKRFSILIVIIFFIESCKPIPKLSQKTIINGDEIITKNLKMKNFSNRHLFDKNIAEINLYLEKKEKRIYTDIFEELDYNGVQFYSFYVANKNQNEYDEKIVFKFSENKIEQYFLRYKRINWFEINPDTFELTLLITNKSNVIIKPLKITCLQYQVININKNKESSGMLAQHIGVFSIELNCKQANIKGKEKKDFLILSELPEVPYYLVY